MCAKSRRFNRYINQYMCSADFTFQNYVMHKMFFDFVRQQIVSEICTEYTISRARKALFSQSVAVLMFVTI